ncbi:MAG: prolyl-tRNA synthetase associated domain-containing protein [Oscillospiraceae bacterium]|nr:prolyl-tRNA synthetase associated domain-containing protein [Oscillospiraceae bacterium]
MYLDPALYTSRPPEKRSAIEEQSYDLLESLNIPFVRADHEHADTIEACHAVEELLGCKICKNLLLTNRQMTDVYLLLTPGDKPFKTKYLSKQLGCARLSFASAEQMMETLGITPGSVSVLGLMNDRSGRVRLLIDRDLLRDEYLGCHPCMNTSSLKLRMEDVLNRVLPAVAHEYTAVELPWNPE